MMEGRQELLACMQLRLNLSQRGREDTQRSLEGQSKRKGEDKRLTGPAGPVALSQPGPGMTPRA